MVRSLLAVVPKIRACEVEWPCAETVILQASRDKRASIIGFPDYGVD